MPIIFMLCVIGSCLIDYNPFDVKVMFVFGLALAAVNVPSAPFLLGVRPHGGFEPAPRFEAAQEREAAKVRVRLANRATSILSGLPGFHAKRNKPVFPGMKGMS
ncbi:MAG: tripartite tricarboxylate transporter permease [Candidatus Accumulibacter sp.]|jgi:hypothetical protein|nr:tripartite tricarboxylate transporter permease [Accumulibacter sp.]